jgi:hypothetical protein
MMMRLADNERRAQKLTADESCPRLPLWAKQFYPQMRTRSNQGFLAQSDNDVQNV